MGTEFDMPLLKRELTSMYPKSNVSRF